MTVMVDDAGIGDPVGGCVIGALRVEDGAFIWGLIPVCFFQEPLFREKKYLEEAVRVVLRCLKRLEVRKGEAIKVCRGDIFRFARKQLSRKFDVEAVKIEGELQLLVEEVFLEHLFGLGVPREMLSVESGKERFVKLLRWVYEKPEERLKVAKTGWRSWWRKLDGWGKTLAEKKL